MTDEREETIDIGVLSALVGYHLRRAASVVLSSFNRTIDDTGVRQVLFGVMSIIERNPGINQGLVGRLLGIKRANMVALINELVDGGLLGRRVSADDRRAFALRLTAKGRRAHAYCLERVRANEDALMTALDAHERALLIALLGRIEANED